MGRKHAHPPEIVGYHVRCHPDIARAVVKTEGNRITRMGGPVCKTKYRGTPREKEMTTLYIEIKGIPNYKLWLKAGIKLDEDWLKWSYYPCVWRGELSVDYYLPLWCESAKRLPLAKGRKKTQNVDRNILPARNKR